MKYAVIKLGGKQFMVQEGDVLELEHQIQPLKIDVLAYTDEETSLVGTPLVAGVAVVASVVADKMSKKVLVARFKRKVRYDKANGHRQVLSIVKIDEINHGEAKNKPVKTVEAPEVKIEKKEKATKPVKKVATKKVAEKVTN